MDNYQINVASPPDREKLVAEIMLGRIQWAEVNQENDEFEVEFYSRPDGEPWRIRLDTAIRALIDAKSKLSD